MNHCFEEGHFGQEEIIRHEIRRLETFPDFSRQRLPEETMSLTTDAGVPAIDALLQEIPAE